MIITIVDDGEEMKTVTDCENDKEAHVPEYIAHALGCAVAGRVDGEESIMRYLECEKELARMVKIAKAAAMSEIFCAGGKDDDY